MDAVFAALSDATRRGMIQRLARGPATVGELGRPYPISKPAVSKHVKTLERAGLIRRERDGRMHRCTLDTAPLRRAEDWIEHNRRFWERSLDALARYVTAPPPIEGDTT
jgi:DNA-binding transcriptional ArsR family regulator